MKRTGRGHRRVREITESDVEHFIERPKTKESTRHKRLIQLSEFLAWCVDQGYRDDNPAAEYKRKRNRGLSNYAKRKRSRDAREALMPDDLRTLLGKINDRGKHFFLNDVLLFALATGLRRNELTHLNRRDVHLDTPPEGLAYPVTGWVRVRCWTNPQTGEQFITKNGKDHIVPLCPLAARIAFRNLEEAKEKDPWLPVFRALQGGCHEGKRLSQWFHTYRTKVGFTDRVTYHSLRHSFASWLMMLGVNLFSIKRLLGHSSLDQLDTYAELCEEYLLGDARSVQRQMLFVLCPDLPEHIVDHILPRRRSLLAALSDEKFGRVQTLRSIIPMEDVLFSGIAYEATRTDSEETSDTHPNGKKQATFLRTL